MVSSTLTGERRWAARRGGMTVLGKVAVPKPINLPSQRLENHGLDPNVEIVPKGTHSWGSRSSSSSSNAWGSSTLSPSDGGTGSPSYLSGRPSSGGGTRPSTAGSDRGHEPIANVWSSSSRPSSASGPLKSSQTSIASSRPCSADTRPGSSQLSRFAEPLSDNSVAWGALGTAEKLGVAPSKKDSFSLTSGDFPTLGSEKENSTKNTDIEEHVFPHDSPSGGEPVQERTADAVAMDSGSVDVNSDNANAWRRDCSFYEREGVRPNVQQWHADPQPFHNSPISQHFDAWRGPPLNNHPGGGVWYGGPPGGPPFGPHGFPMEAFPYYRPQIPPGAMANAQTVPQQPSAGPRGPHPKHGDVFRPPSHDAYIRPGMPIRPGFYPGPVPYEGYYGPPMAYNGNASERDIPYMGMPVGPATYNRYPNQNAHESGNSHGRSSGFGTNNGKGFFPEQVESGRHPHDAQGPYKVLLKQHDGWEGKPGEQKWDDNRAANVVHPGKGDHPRNSALENGRRTDQMKRDDDVETKRVLSGRDSGIVDPKIGASSVRLKGTENRGKLDPSDTGLDQISEHGERGASLSESVSCSRDPSLIKKIEGLNAKARAADGRQDAKSVSSKDEQKNKQKFDSIRNNHHPANEAVSGFAPQEQPRSNVSVTAGSFDDKISGRDKSLDLTVSGGTGITRSTQGMHIGIHHRGKGSSNTQDTDSWRRRTHVTESNDGVSSAHISSVVQDQDCMSIDAAEKSLSHQGNGGELMLQASEPSDTQAQRAKMRELARQRLKQREKEEEERTREQKAKALAKLEELNRRMQLGEGSSQKLETSSSTTLPNKQEELLNSTQPSVIANASAANSVLASNSVAVAPTNEGIANRVEILAPFSNEVLQEESKKNSSEAPVVMHDPSKSQHQDSGAESVINIVRQEYDGATKQKRMNNRQKQNSYSERTSGDKVSLTTTEASKTHNTDAMPDPSVPLQAVGLDIASNSEANLPVSPSATAESSASHHRRKNRSTRNKQKAEEVVPPTVGSPTSVPSIDTTTALEVSNECVKPKTLEASVVASSSVQLVQDRKGASGQQPMEQQHPTSPNGDVQVKSSSNQWKPQSSRRMSRNPQSNNKTMDNKFHGSSDTVIWAPVRSHNNKSDGAADEGNKKSAESASLPHVKSGDQQVQNTITKNKRAEMERYVPKPVAKEMAQQGNANHSVVSSSVVVQMTSHETVVGSVSIPLRPESAQTSVTLQFGSIAEATRNAEGTRQIKPGKVQGSSWRQHSSAESQTSTSNLSFQKSTESQRQPHNISEAISSVKEQLSEQNDEWTYGWTMPEEPNAPVPVSSFKDRTATARGRRQPQKGQSRVGYNPDSVETRIGGDVEKAHTQSWLPKSQSTSATGQRTTKPNNNDGQNVVTAEACSRPNKRGSSSTTVGVSVPPPRDKEVAAGRTNEVYPSDQESGRRERKVVTSHKGYNNSGGPIEPPAFDQNYSSSGYRRGSGNQSNRDLQEARGEWSGTARDNNRQHNVPGANREKPMRQSSHYEYQPVGQQNKSKGTNFEPSSNDGSHASGSRFRERVPNHARRGGGDFHGRQGGSFRVLDTNTD